MRKYNPILLVIVSAIFMTIACQNHPGMEPEKIKDQPISETAIDVSQDDAFTREAPFVKREFKPFLGEKWIGKAISYGCYREGQAPGVKGPSEAEILEDLNILSPYWNLIRVYGSDDDSERILKVIKANNLPIKLMLGIWLENETKHPERKSANLEQVTNAIDLANRFPEIIAAINVGNESQVFWSWHHMEMSSLIPYIRMVREGTMHPVTTADDYNFWNKPESQQLAQELDFIVLHAYALWNGQKLDHAVQWTDSVYQDIKARHPEMTIALGETGWATTYNPEKTGPGEQGSLIKGEVSIAAQERFLIELNHWIDENQVTTFLFEAFDEPWKGGGDQTGPDEVEKHWGVFDADRSPKLSFKNYARQLEMNKQ